MGSTKKGTMMKIDNALQPLNAAHKLPINDKSQAFEAWLNTHGNHRDGSEYYWLYQDRLQQSALDFSAKPYTHQKEIPLIITKHGTAFNDKKLDNEDTLAVCITHQSLTTTKQATLQADLAPLPPQPLQSGSLNNRASPIPTVCILTTNQDFLPNNTVDATALSTRTMHDFKNHRLFIHNEEAEISLNLPALKTKDFKQLTQLIKKIITQQGLLLKSLIINGVKL